MTADTFKTILSKESLAQIFPKERANEFFEALFGDANEGAYDIELAYRESNGETLTMELQLHQRPNQCLSCNLTQGLPQVFSRHPIINVDGVVKEIDKLLGETVKCVSWTLGYTEQTSNSVHVIPIKIQLDK
jgi:hypothetical protein